jgi:regulator of protease activity HflC (stomatin/prohibitin superfamily)
MWVILAIIFIILIFVIFEYRIRKPDQIVLYESKGKVKRRKSRFYLRHFSIAVPGTTHSIILKIEADAKGRIPVKVSLALSVAASSEHLSALVRAGGWSRDMVVKATHELEVLLQSYAKEISEKFEIEELTSETLSQHLHKKLGKTVDTLGIEILALSVQAIDPIDEEISEAMQQRETSRILEQTEEAKQNARVAASQARITADEKIAFSEHKLELKKFELKKVAEENEAALDLKRVAEEIKRREMQLQFDREEISLLKNNPELIMLSPQMTRLAEASQNLRNARTIVTLSPQEITQGSQVLGMLQTFLQNMIQGSSGNPAKKADSKK